MRWRFYIWAGILIGTLVASGVAMRHLAVENISSAESLIARGFVCLLLVFIFARKQRLKLTPNSLSTQVLRGLLAGLALTLFTLSYKWLTASAVSVLSNVDVPLLIALGPWVGLRASWRVRALALSSLLFLLYIGTGIEAQTDVVFGLGFLMSGTLLLCFGYLFIKRSMSEENEAVTILVPAIAILCFGLLQAGALQIPLGPWNLKLILIAALAGASMFGAYYATMRLYEMTDLASAEFPTLLASVVIQPIEMLFLSVPFESSYAAATIGFVAVTYFLLRLQKFENANLTGACNAEGA